MMTKVTLILSLLTRLSVCNLPQPLPHSAVIFISILSSSRTQSLMNFHNRCANCGDPELVKAGRNRRQIGPLSAKVTR